MTKMGLKPPFSSRKMVIHTTKYVARVQIHKKTRIGTSSCFCLCHGHHISGVCHFHCGLDIHLPPCLGWSPARLGPSCFLVRGLPGLVSCPLSFFCLGLLWAAVLVSLSRIVSYSRYAFSCHDGVSMISGIVANDLSNTKWYRGDTCPVVKSSTRDISLEWCGEYPMYIPTRALFPHLRKGLFCFRLSCKTYARHPKCAKFLGLLCMDVPV